MNRKKFLKTSALGLGFSVVSGIPEDERLGSDTSLSGVGKPLIVKESEGDVLNVIGDIQRHKLVGEDTGNQIVEWVDDVEPGAGIPIHIHTKEDEIFRVIKGQIEILIDGQTTILEEGDVAFAPKEVAHSWKVVGTEKAQMITSAFPAGIEIMFQELADLPAGPPDFGKVSEICGRYGIRFL